MTIGQLAKATRTDPQTIRYYESIGVLSVPPRNESGYRVYGADAVAMLRFTRHAKSAGFTLSEIKRLTQLIDGRERQCGKMRAFLQRKLERLTAQIAELQTVRESLATLRQLCEDADELADCPALESLMSGRPVRGHES